MKIMYKNKVYGNWQDITEEDTVARIGELGLSVILKGETVQTSKAYYKLISEMEEMDQSYDEDYERREAEATGN